jgi:hypothetical protein
VFNDKFIEGKLANMTDKKQARVIRGLNKLANNYKGLIRKRDVPSVVRKSRRRSYVKIRDIMELIK